MDVRGANIQIYEGTRSINVSLTAAEAKAIIASAKGFKMLDDDARVAIAKIKEAMR